MDFALETGIPFGWAVTKTGNRVAAAGHKPHVTEITGGAPLIGQNVAAFHGTLIISHGELTGAALQTKKLADRLNHPCLQIDLARIGRFTAAEKINRWVSGHGIETLHIVGDGPEVYRESLKLLRGSYYLAALNLWMSDTPIRPLPTTVEEALESLTAGMSLKEKTRIARMEEGERAFFHPALAAYARERFGLSAGNRTLMTSCRLACGTRDLGVEGASSLIISRLCERLKSTHSLRVVIKGKVCMS